LRDENKTPRVAPRFLIRESEIQRTMICRAIAKDAGLAFYLKPKKQVGKIKGKNSAQRTVSVLDQNSKFGMVITLRDKGASRALVGMETKFPTRWKIEELSGSD